MTISVRPFQSYCSMGPPVCFNVHTLWEWDTQGTLTLKTSRNPDLWWSFSTFNSTMKEPVKKLHVLFSKVLYSQNASFSSLFLKKDSCSDGTKDEGIGLIRNESKLIAPAVLCKLYNAHDEQSREEQTRFRAVHGLFDQIFTLRQLSQQRFAS